MRTRSKAQNKFVVCEVCNRRVKVYNALKLKRGIYPVETFYRHESCHEVRDKIEKRQKAAREIRLRREVKKERSRWGRWLVNKQEYLDRKGEESGCTYCPAFIPLRIITKDEIDSMTEQSERYDDGAYINVECGTSWKNWRKEYFEYGSCHRVYERKYINTYGKRVLQRHFESPFAGGMASERTHLWDEYQNDEWDRKREGEREWHHKKYEQEQKRKREKERIKRLEYSRGYNESKKAEKAFFASLALVGGLNEQT